MKKLKIVLLFFPFTIFCQSVDINDEDYNLLSLITTIYNESQKQVESYQNCEQISDKYYQKLYKITSSETKLDNYEKTEIKQIIKMAFNIRLNIREQLALYQKALDKNGQCLIKIQNLNRALRYVEDYSIEYLAEESVKYQTLQGKEPVLLTNKAFQFNSFKDLKSGDVILSRGNAYTSAAIARIGISDAQFSHLSLVYKDEKDQLYTVESHIEIGSVVAPFQKHIDQDNVRAVVFRYEDEDLAHKAAKYMYDKVKAQSEKGKNIAYDFGMDYLNSDTLFCSEVIYDGFTSVSSGQVDVPIHKTNFNQNLIPFLNKMGVNINNENYNEFKTFAPGDIELDHRFSLVAEWRNPNKLRDSRTKDAILTKMFKWIETENYEFRPRLKIALFSNLSWLLRRTPIVKKSLDHKFPLNMSTKQLNLFLVLDKVGEIIHKEVDTYQNKIQHPMSPKDLFDCIEELKTKDFETYQDKKRKSKFHRWFSPNGV